MRLRHVDKPQYRKMTNQVQVGLIAILAISSVVFGQILIALLGSTSVEAGQPTGNFYFNFAGVILGLMLCTLVVKYGREKPQYSDVYYVFQLKQLQNKIYRKLNAVQKSAAENNHDALVILCFYYQSLALVYELDNNTLTITEVNKQIAALEKQIADNQLTCDVSEFDIKLLARF